MPINEDFWNPYRFVPTRETVQRRPPFTDERFRGLSGSVTCILTNLTLLLVAGGDRGQQQFLQRDNRPFLPGSSLKGMLRSLAEIVGGGCFVTSRNNSCTDPARLCVACRMYGMLHRGSVHKGQVSPGDGLLQDEQQARRKNVEIIQGQPKRSHDAFYRHPKTGDVSEEMMKMYFHQPHRSEDVLPIPSNLRDRKVVKEMLLPGHAFTFTVHFENLAEDELNLLLYTLALEEQVSVTLTPQDKPPIHLTGPLRHKLGNAKGQGPGSCHIQVQSLTLLPDPARRFQSLGREQVRVLIGADLEQEIQSRTAAYRQDDTPTMQFLRKMMVWDPADERDFRYPDFNWFRATGNSAVPLKSI
jgi:CRISPR/Cas system CSM-associated protein Csm3 (group 7 of RAMP superfamily)